MSAPVLTGALATPEPLSEAITLHCGDCLAILDALPENSVDAVVCDPPYHLLSIVKRFGGAGAAAAKDYSGERDGATGAYARASRGFMGKEWDGGDIAFRPETWAQVLRVLKPGGHLVAFAAPKLVHRMTSAIEDSGFEIRDRIIDLIASDEPVRRFLASLSPEQVEAFMLALDTSGFLGELFWTFGTGFPKSHDPAKAIDKRRVEDIAPIRAVCRFVRAAMDAKGLRSRDMVGHFGGCNPRLIDHWAARDTDSQPALPTPAQWATLKTVLELSADMDGEVERLNARKGEYSDDWKSAAVLGEYERDPAMGFGDHRFTARDRLIREASDEAAAWQGYGTALKPAYEPIVLARKPLSEDTVAANVLKWRTGALNIDAARIEAEGGSPSVKRREGGAPSNCRPGEYSDHAFINRATPERYEEARPGELLGRWPANLCHDGSNEVAAAFPETDKAAAPGRSARARPTAGESRGTFKGTDAEAPTYDDSGSAARFFFSAKADGDDRLGSKHPTVKPIDLMRWLVRMVCPKGGVVLDPFAGTGTTGEAAALEGCKAVLIEREAEYQNDIRRRVALMGASPLQRRIESIKASGKQPKKDSAPLLALLAPEAAQ